MKGGRKQADRGKAKGVSVVMNKYEREERRVSVSVYRASNTTF